MRQFAYNRRMQNLLVRIFGSLYGRHLNQLVITGSVLLLLMLTVFVSDSNVALFRFFNGLSDYTGTGLWANITSLGEGLIVLSLAGMVAIRWPAAAWAVLIGGIVGTLIVHGLKEAVGAFRPAMVLPEGSFTIIGPRLMIVSFPSGHTATITAFATILFLHARRTWFTVFLLALVVLVGVSRVAVGAHWPIDVLAGWLVGMVIAVISFVLAERWTVGTRVPVQFGIILLSILCAASLFWLEPYMSEAVVLRWVIAVVGLVSGAVALVVTHQRNGAGQAAD